MSLLIKALDKAQNAKTEQAQVEKDKAKTETKATKKAESGLELSLSPSTTSMFEESVAAPVTKVSVAAANTVAATSSASPKSAANVFSARGVDVSKQNTTLALIAGAGLIALLVMGLYYYQFADNTPDVVIPPRSLEVVQTQPQPLPPSETSPALPESTVGLQAAEMSAPQAFEPDNDAQASAKMQATEMQEASITKMVKKPVVSEIPEPAKNEEIIVAENETVVDAAVIANTNKKRGKSKKLQFGESIASPSASINVSKTKSEAAGVNPVLMSAYEAYNAGDDAKAQKLYKQVLQRDVRNVDALLGLGAIASRQGRDADANGWFSKVLEVDPRNSMAQAALLDSQPQGNETNSESRIKNMLAKHPDDANLHVALGNLYAEQNQWPAAQQAYFDAYSLNASADNAFNLAVSLDQMGKPKLALPYYQRALEQASSTSSIDKAALQARIAAIQ
jgi:tetratricopeptide (TPR) repeat protein